MSLSLTYNFNTEAEVIAHLALVAGNREFPAKAATKVAKKTTKKKAAAKAEVVAEAPTEIPKPALVAVSVDREALTNQFKEVYNTGKVQGVDNKLLGDKTVALLSTYGVAKLPDLADDQITDFVNKFTTTVNEEIAKLPVAEVAAEAATGTDSFI